MCATLIFCLSGKQDYKKTKSALKATRLKAEAKKNSSGFRVRLAWTYSLFRTTCRHVFQCFCLLVCPGPSMILLIFLSANCLLCCVSESVSLDHFTTTALSSLTTCVRSLGNVTTTTTCNDVMRPPAYPLKICASVGIHRPP